MKTSPNLKAAMLDGVVTYLWIPPCEELKTDSPDGVHQTLEVGGEAILLGTDLRTSNKLARKLDKENK